MADSTALLKRRGGQTPPRVRIPPSPLFSIAQFSQQLDRARLATSMPGSSFFNSACLSEFSGLSYPIDPSLLSDGGVECLCRIKINTFGKEGGDGYARQDGTVPP